MTMSSADCDGRFVHTPVGLGEARVHAPILLWEGRPRPDSPVASPKSEATGERGKDLIARPDRFYLSFRPSTAFGACRTTGAFSVCCAWLRVGSTATDRSG